MTKASDVTWREPSTVPALQVDAIHVWRASLPETSARRESLQRFLDSDEQGRAARFRFACDRERFVIRRGLLRVILGRYLDQDPGQLRFQQGENGKPAIADDSARDVLSFNMTHSHDLALYAITRHRPVGIDVERHRKDLEYMQIAEEFFSHREVAELRALTGNAQLQAFFNLWTCKEAFAKATGAGLSLPLSQIEVHTDTAGLRAFGSIEGSTEQATEWSLHELSTIPDYSAALVARGRDWKLSCWQWTNGE